MILSEADIGSKYKEKTLQGKISFLVEQPLSKEGLKMFHRPPRPEDNVHNIVGGKGTKVLLKNKVIGASLTEAAWSPRVFFIFWLNSHLGSGGSPCLLT